ncbi:MAG: glycoside hydrolase family 6 protein, partial [Anaerolineae bacterium]|uniref:glycoside hydrolase family 6 protein n=1 Tax=Thermoflexus sp. TaxID=1969742 RepID=UPI002992505C|nr:glycoside hydrolase family 6 protein [Anaerolineae bacterium]
MDNPYAGARGYVNPDWVTNVISSANAVSDPTLQARMLALTNTSTAVWMDRIAAITAGRGLQGHLNEALNQMQQSGQPVVITVVIYNLPNRDCAA